MIADPAEMGDRVIGQLDPLGICQGHADRMPFVFAGARGYVVTGKPVLDRLAAPARVNPRWDVRATFLRVCRDAVKPVAQPVAGLVAEQVDGIEVAMLAEDAAEILNPLGPQARPCLRPKVTA